MNKEEIDVITKTEIERKIKEIEETLEDKQQHLSELREEKQNIDSRIQNVKKSTNEIVENGFNTLEENNTFSQEIKNTVFTLKEVINKVSETQKEFVDLFQLAFKKVSTETVVIPIEDAYLSDIRDNWRQLDFAFISLYHRGFGYKKEANSPSKYISNYHTIKQLLTKPEIKDYITKRDKREMFDAFMDYANNLIDPDRFFYFSLKDYKKQEGKILKIIYYDIGYNYDKGSTITKETVDDVTAEFNMYGLEMRIGYRQIDFDNLNFGQIYAFSQVWSDLKEFLQDKIDYYKTVVDNNRIVIEKLKKTISNHISVELL